MFQKLKQKHQERRKRRYLLMNQPSAYDHAILSWIAPEALRHERGRVWKIIMGIIMAGLITWSIYTKIWTFTVALIAVIATYSLVSLDHPKDVEIKISNIGIKVGARKYPYSRIRAFWLIYELPHVETLNIRVRGELAGDITIQLDGQNPSEVREILMEKIPELEGQNEKFSDILFRLLKL
ncbi:hypothetical protein HYW82_00180 [Candidatus Peregrinibacteria bacterium]|nr:hypothetical protein [Candidatus Peregrinibacteria bacterium]